MSADRWRDGRDAGHLYRRRIRLAGFIVGVVDREKLVTGAENQAGDVLVGLPSNGLHTNGYSLARKPAFSGQRRHSPDHYLNEIKNKVWY